MVLCRHTLRRGCALALALSLATAAACTRWGFPPLPGEPADGGLDRASDHPTADGGRDAARDSSDAAVDAVSDSSDAAGDAADDAVADAVAERVLVDTLVELAVLDQAVEAIGSDAVFPDLNDAGLPDLNDAAQEGAPEASPVFDVGPGPDSGTTGEFGWVVQLGGAQTEKAGGVAVSTGGKIVVVGAFQQQIDLGGGAIPTHGGTDIFVAWLDPTGQVDGGRTFGGPGDDFATTVAVDASGQVFIGGVSGGAMDLGGGAIPVGGFVASLNPSLGHRWSIGVGSGELRAVAVAGETVYVAGNFNTKVNLGGGELATAGGDDFYIGALKGEDGSHHWSYSYGDAEEDLIADLALDAGGLYATGAFTGSLLIGGKAMASVGASDTWLAKLDPVTASGKWELSFGTSTVDRGVALCVGKDHVTVGAIYDQTIEIKPGVTHDAAGMTDVLLVSYDKDSGSYVWSADVASGGFDQVGGLTATGDGEVFVTGSFTGTVLFKGAILQSEGMQDIFIARLNPAGGMLWAEDFGGEADDRGVDIALHSNLIVTIGTFRKTVDFGGGPLHSGDETDVFVLGLGR